MSDSQQNPWSNNPNAPKIPRALYLEEKATFAGTLIGSILYGAPKTLPPTSPPLCAYFVWFVPGIIIVLFFQCMVAMFYPVRPRDGNIKWGLASYTAVMFSVVTVFTATNLNIQSLSFVDHLEFDFADDLGPLGYQLFIRTTILSRIPDIMFLLNGWLADGLLVSSSFDTAFAHRSLTQALPPALPLLHNLLYESLGHRRSLPHVLLLVGYVFNTSTHRRPHSGLTSLL